MKETRLQEDAYIYHRKKEMNEKQKWREMNRSEKLQYFKDYYLIKTAAGIAAIGFGVWFLSAVFSPKTETELYIAMINSGAAHEKEAQLTAQLVQLLETESEESIVIDSSYFIQLETMDQGSMGAVQKLAAQAYSKMLDIVIANDEEFDYLAAQGYFLDLAEALPTNLYSRVSDQIYLTRTQETKGETVEYGESTAYGIYLDGFSRFESLGTGLEKPVIGIVSNTAHRKNSVKMLEYLTK